VFKNISEWKAFPSESAVEKLVRLIQATNHAKAKMAEKEGSYRSRSSPKEELPFKTAIIFEQSEPASSVSYKIRMDNEGQYGIEIFSTEFMSNNFERYRTAAGKQMYSKLTETTI
jgi:hypothetical protein